MLTIRHCGNSIFLKSHSHARFRIRGCLKRSPAPSADKQTAVNKTATSRQCALTSRASQVTCELGVPPVTPKDKRRPKGTAMKTYCQRTKRTSQAGSLFYI